jgi:hypothetical protein
MNLKYMELLKLKRPVVLYPLLLIVLFILSRLRIFEVNPDWKDILLFFVLNIAGQVLIFQILSYFVKDRFKTWLIDFMIFAFFLYYYKIKAPVATLAFIQNILEPLGGFGGLAIIGLEFLIMAAFCLFIVRYKGSMARISQYLNLVLSLLIVYQLYAIATQNSSKITLVNKPDEVKKTNTVDLPDIYYIILDAYTSNQSLKNYWDFSNDSITDFLHKKGFYIAGESKTNYNITLLSLASSLNMSYLKNFPRTEVSAAQARNLYNLVDSSLVVNTLLKNDYKIVNYSFFDIPESPKYYSDFFFLIKRNLLNQTIYLLIEKMFDKKWTKNQNAGLLSFKKINPDILNKIKDQRRSDKPLFVYAHVMMPHYPYLFDESGVTHEDESVFISGSKDKYLEQLKYLNKLLINTITSITNNNPLKPPVIIIQGDHGYRDLSGPDKKEESMTIINAYYFPDKEYSKIYNSITPVNSFRVVFNKYLNTNLQLLKDTSYYNRFE